MRRNVEEWFRRVWYLINRRKLELELRQEMEAHRELMGEPVGFGNTLRLREESRDVWGWNWLDDLSRNVKYGIRGLRREPTFTLTAILTLALGIATITTVFSVVDAELWKPLPFPDPEQLIAIYSRGPAEGAMVDVISGADILDWRAATPALAELAAAGNTARRILHLSTAESVLVTEVTANYLSTLGREPMGGGMLPARDAPGLRVGILTDRVWRRVFAADPSVIGRSVTLDAETVVIGGIVPANDSLGPDPDLFLLADESSPSFLDRSKPMFYGAIGRLKPGVDASVVRSQLQSAQARLGETASGDRAGHIVYVEDLSEYYLGVNWRPLYFFLAAAFVVLLLSGVNVATLLLARAFRRTKEFALRGALGGDQRSLARQLLVEGGLLALCSALTGVLLTSWAVTFFAAQLPSEFLLRGTHIPIDFRVYAFVLVVTGLTIAAFALTPLLPLRRFDLTAALSSGSRTGHSAAEGRIRRMLLTAQVALTVILLAGAGVFLKSFDALTRVPLGFDPANSLAVRATLSGPGYAREAGIQAYADQLLDGARAIPGVRVAAIASSSPLGSGPVVPFAVPGPPNSPANKSSRAILRTISPEYFRTLGIRIVRGRDFSTTDVSGAPRVAIVNESLARENFGTGDPVGRVIELLPGARAPWTRKPGAVLIVGVVSNVKEVGLNEIGFPDIYVPFAQTPAPWIELIVRADVPIAALGGPLREHAARVDTSVPVTSLFTFEERVTSALQGDRFNLLLISGFAGVALLLAAVGIYGAITYNVQQRTRELGVRLALGARPQGLVAAALWEAARIGIAGGAFGLAGALAIAAVIGDALYLVPGAHNGLLFGVTTTDPVMLGAAFLGIVTIAVVAGAVPAHRVSRLDPVQALKSE